LTRQSCSARQSLLIYVLQPSFRGTAPYDLRVCCALFKAFAGAANEFAQAGDADAIAAHQRLCQRIREEILKLGFDATFREHFPAEGARPL
jgi:hypothetical protein